MSQQIPTSNTEKLLRALRLPSFLAHHRTVSDRAEREGWSYIRYLNELSELEVVERGVRRIERNRKSSRLPSQKRLSSLDRSRLPIRIQRQLPRLCNGEFVERGENLLAFGLPGRGKTHLVCAIGHELVDRGHRVLFVAAYQLVERLLTARRELLLESELRRLDRFDAVIVDDIGYIQQDRAEMEVLFTFLAERYERKSVLITSNLVFSQWDRIFKDAMTTAAAIDRVVHHAIILELTGSSYRADAAKSQNEESTEPNDKTPESTNPTREI